MQVLAESWLQLLVMNAERAKAYVHRHAMCRRTVRLLAEHGHLDEVFMDAAIGSPYPETSDDDFVIPENSPVLSSGVQPSPNESAARPSGVVNSESSAPSTAGFIPIQEKVYRIGGGSCYHYEGCHQLGRKDTKSKSDLLLCPCVELHSPDLPLLRVGSCNTLHQDDSCTVAQRELRALQSSGRRVDHTFLRCCSACISINPADRR